MRTSFKCYSLGVTVEEAEILRKADEILHQLQLDFGDSTTIISAETGECVCPGEISRSRAILGFMAQYNAVTVE